MQRQHRSLVAALNIFLAARKKFQSPLHGQQTRGLLSSLFKQQYSSEPPVYPRQPSTFHLGHIQLTDDYGWLSDYEAARPYLQQEQRHFEATTRQWSQQARQLLQDMEQHLAAVQLDDPPEQVGPFLYFSTSNPHGPDTILRRCTASGGQQVVLSAGIMQQDAAQASRLLGLEVLGGQLGNVKLSSDHRLLAYSLEVHSTQQQAAEQHCCIVRDINAGAAAAAPQCCPDAACALVVL